MGGKSTRKRGGKEEVLEEGLVGRGLGRGVGRKRSWKRGWWEEDLEEGWVGREVRKKK